MDQQAKGCVDRKEVWKSLPMESFTCSSSSWLHSTVTNTSTERSPLATLPPPSCRRVINRQFTRDQHTLVHVRIPATQHNTPLRNSRASHQLWRWQYLWHVSGRKPMQSKYKPKKVFSSVPTRPVAGDALHLHLSSK